MKLLIIGAKGQLGYELQQLAPPSGHQVTAVDLPECDITRPADIARMMQPPPDLVVNAAAYTQVDRAESEPELARAVNCDGPAHLAQACARFNIPLIHVSTDFVFDGQARAPYREADPVHPLSVYGQTKAQGEVRVRETLAQHIILRTAWLYSAYGANFVKTILRLAGERDTLSVVADQQGCPTWAANLAEAVLTIVSRYQQNPNITWGTYHYTGAGMTTWHGFAEKILELARRFQTFKIARIASISTAEYPTPARRPAYSVLNCQRIEREFGISPRPWEDSLGKMLTQYLGEK